MKVILMFRYHVNSPSICSIGYDNQAKVLGINYHKKGSYQYRNVPLIVYQRLSVAKNKELYVEKNIDNSYMAIKKPNITSLA
ncbi:KTSC domain-containing protein [Providencia manganoxydans]|uniref:KTSC domain-containing protein n=1 Tax=Providencia manganoxydans TaxID=2923283 RepID=UPI0034E4BE6A